MRSSHRSVFHRCSTLHASVAVNCDKRRMKVGYSEDTEGARLTRRCRHRYTIITAAQNHHLCLKALRHLWKPTPPGAVRRAEPERVGTILKIWRLTLAPDSYPEVGPAPGGTAKGAADEVRGISQNRASEAFRGVHPWFGRLFGQS